MKIEKDRAEVTSGRAPRAHARQPGRAADRQPRLRQLGGADEPVAGRGRGGRGAPAAARPRRPRGRPEVRLHRRAQRARARQRARDRRARGRRRAGQGVPARARGRGAQPRDAASAPWRRRERDEPVAPATSRASTSRPCAASTPRRATAMVAEINAARKANESLGGVFEVVAFGLVPGHRLARLLGGAPGRPAGRRRSCRSRR